MRATRHRRIVKIPKPSDADKAYFASIVPEAPGVETKPMFGNVAAFVNGNMFMGLFGRDVGVRLAAEDREDLLAIDGTGPFGPPERPMREYVSLPPSWRDDPPRTAEWVDRALRHTAAMPPKVKKPR
jgi:TfoX/Sxy family transcriptional regulator of competence genes